MTPKQVKDIFDKLPSKRRKVLVGFLAGHSREKIMIDADVPSDAALTGHLKELYKNFRIDTGWNDADDRRSGTRKLPLLISLFARCMPELISDRIPQVLDRVEQEEAIAKPYRESVESDAGSIEERYFKATNQFDSLKPLERKSRIQVLGKIAKHSRSYHWDVMEFLADFVRTNAPRKEEEEGGEEQPPKISEDIQAALTVIGQRNWMQDQQNKRLDLSNIDIRGAILNEANLHRVILTKANLQDVNFDRAYLQEAILKETNLKKANFYNTKLQETDLRKANLQEVCFLGADLQGAFLSATNMQGVNLQGATLKGASLSIANLEGANLQGADLSRANLQGANFMGANLLEVDLTESNLQGTKLRGADLTNAKNLKLQQIELAYVDSTTTLPDYLERLTD